jgi:hypothetical protein
MRMNFVLGALQTIVLMVAVFISFLAETNEEMINL